MYDHEDQLLAWEDLGCANLIRPSVNATCQYRMLPSCVCDKREEGPFNLHELQDTLMICVPMT